MINELKETHNQNVDQQNGFHHLLDEMGIPYQENENFLTVGNLSYQNGWVIFLSVNSHELGDLIKNVAPVLYELKVAFSCVKSENIAEKVNDFWYGADEVGRLFTVYSNDEDITRQALKKLTMLTKCYSGPQVNNAIRVERVLYVTYITFQQEEGSETEKKQWKFSLSAPPVKKIPFKINAAYKYWRRKRILKRRYVPLEMIARSSKGDLLKAIDMKGFRFGWCFIKEGKSHVFVDKHGRDIKDRFKWQRQLLQALQNDVAVPKFIDYFEQGEECYLVMEYLEGIDLNTKIYAAHKEKKWDEWEEESRREFIGYYLQVLEILEKMHQKGYVHRDATANNFIILPSKELYTIDLELSYNLNTRQPDVPFTLGSFGYVSPQQANVEVPTVKEDIYAMGSLLIHVIVGRHPRNFITLEHEVDIEGLRSLITSGPVLDLILKCLENEPEKRPELNEIKQVIRKVFTIDIL
ncbi:protein kinase [Chitinophaga oryzae]|uniref:Protein kinase n=1 Tax=Chitinophaga oryzae TaxID=2725414 RepID=A0ABX6LBJ3_9BACT|nr:protein kinase [Chitinophaga oryzae]QJB37304.1 protein kinase [Chitinophaga oryzae]